MNDYIENGKAEMRGLIHTGGIAKASVAVAERYAAPANAEDHAMLAGMVLAAYEAGQLSGVNL